VVLVLSILLSVHLGEARAAENAYKLSHSSIRIEKPEGWQAAHGLFGMPLTLLGPEADSSRPVIGITDTGQKSEVIENKITNDTTIYRKERSHWVEKHQGKVLEFLPPEKQNLNPDSSAESVGFRYEIANIAYSERSYFINCKGRLYHVKTLVNDSQEPSLSPIIKQAVKSFRCD
jgi:hypothetical protein